MRLSLGLMVVVAGTAALARPAGAGPTPAGASEWRQIAAGEEHTCGVQTSGQLFCWGDDSSGQLGNDAAEADQPTPVEVAGAAPDWKQVSASGEHTCAVKTNRRLFCWGADGNGQLGNDPAEADQPTPVEVAGGAANWKRVSVGGSHTCATKRSGRLFCWGADGLGVLGDDADLDAKPTPVQVAGAATDWNRIAAGDNHTCAVKTTGSAFCWGADNFGQLGVGAPDPSQPTPVQVGGGNWKQITVGDEHTCAVKTSDRLFCWGRDDTGQLGDNTPLAGHIIPVKVAGKAWKQVAAGGDHTCAVKTSKRLFCWGFDIAGQLGDDAPLSDKPTPVEVAGAASDWKTVSAGDRHTCAVKTPRRGFCWGADSNGKLGNDAPLAGQPTPVEVAG